MFKENKTSTKSQENVIHFQPKRDDIKNPGENPTPNDDRGEIPRFHRPFRGWNSTRIISKSFTPAIYGLVYDALLIY